jgi:hypothetical protein
MTAGESTHDPTKPIDRDLYCLTCGYNLRGLSGDPVRCPECGNLNPLGDAEIPAKIISFKLRVMQTAPTGCVLAVIFFLPSLLVFLLVLAEVRNQSDLLCWGTPAAASLLGWVVGLQRFRSSCLAKPGWAGLLVRYHAYGLAATIMVLVPLGLSQHFLLSYAMWHHGTSGWLFFVIAQVAVLVATLTLIRWLLKAPYERLIHDVHTLQREVAVHVAREESRARMTHQRRGPFD